MTRHPGTFAAGVVFLLIGAIYFVEALGGWTVDAARIWPIVLIAVGVTVLFSDSRRSRGGDLPPSTLDEPTDQP